MLDKLVAHIVASYMGKYIDNLDTKQVKVSMWSGNVFLKNLMIKKNALRALGLPISIKSGTIGLLKVYIPWMHLRSESIRVEITKVNIVVHPKKAATYDREQEERDKYEEKLEALASFESLRKEGENKDGTDEASEEDMAKDASFMARLKATLVENILVDVSDISVTYEDEVTDPARPIKMTIQLDNFKVQSCNDRWEPIFSSAGERLHYKLLSIKGLCAAVLSADSFKYILEPIDVLLRARHQPVPFDTSIAEWTLKATLSRVILSVDRKQWDSIWRSVRYIQEFDQVDVFRQYRPHVPVKSDPAAWWKYALDSLLFIIRERKERKKFSWPKFVASKTMQKKYIDLHERRQGATFLSELTPEEIKEIEEIEMALPLDVIKRCRLLTYARLAIKQRQYKEAEFARAAQQPSSAAASGRGWFSWWYGQSAETVDEKERGEIDRAWEIVDAHRWNDEQRRIIAEELGLADDDSATVETVVQTAETMQWDASLLLTNISVQLLDYAGVPFAEAMFKGCCLNYKNGARSWEYSLSSTYFSIRDVSPSAPSLDQNVLVPATDRYASGEPVITAAFKKLDPNVSHGVMYDMQFQLQPINFVLSVPFLQTCVAFWGVRTSLVQDSSKELEFAVEKLPLESQLIIWHEKNNIISILIVLIDAKISIPDRSQDSRCCINFPRLKVCNAYTAELLAKEKYKSVQANTIGTVEPSAWVKEYLVEISGLSIDAFWDEESECRVLHEIDISLTLQQSIVRKNRSLPLFAVSCDTKHPLRVDAERSGLFVMFSAISLVAEFANNASGRGTAYVARNEDYDEEGSVRLLTIGPQPGYVGEDVCIEPAQLASKAAKGADKVGCAIRHVEVQRGWVVLYHDTRPSMPYAKLPLRPDECVVKTDEGRLLVHFYVLQGGEDHSCRMKIQEAWEVLEKYEIPFIHSIPQLRSFVQNRLRSTPLSQEDEEAIMRAVKDLEVASRTIPAQCVSFLVDSLENLHSLDRLLHRNMSSYVQPPQEIMEVADDVRNQRMFSFEMRCPAVTWIVDEIPEVTISLKDVEMLFFITLFGKFVHLQSDGLLLTTDVSADPCISALASEDEASVDFTFASSVLPGTKPEMKLFFHSPISVILGNEMAASMEMMWDITGIALMKHLSCSYVLSLPWGKTKPYEVLPEYMSLEMSANRGVTVAAFYDDGKPPNVRPTPCMTISGSALHLRWGASDSENATNLALFSPSLVLHSPSGDTSFAQPIQSEINVEPSLCFSFTVIHKPMMMSEFEWLGENGFRYTHFMGLYVNRCTITYFQTWLWTVIEYFTNGVMSRLAFLPARPRFTLSCSPTWNSADLPAPVFNYTMMKQDIELVDCEAVLPIHLEDVEPAFTGRCPRIAIHSTLEEDPETKDIRNGTHMEFEGMVLYHNDGGNSANIPLLNGLNISFQLSFELVGMTKELSQKSLHLNLGDMHFHGKTEQLAAMFDWVCGCFMTSWESFYPPKTNPEKPFPELSEKPSVMCDWKISADRLLLHMVDFEKTLDFVLDGEAFVIGLEWRSDGSFLSSYRLNSMGGWDLSSCFPRVIKRFVSDVKEIASSRYRFLRVPRSSNRTPSVNIEYGWDMQVDSLGEPQKHVFGRYAFGTMELDLLPHSLFTLRDTLLSMSVRNGFAAMLRWPRYVPGEVKAPPPRQVQDWTVSHNISVVCMKCVVFRDPSNRSHPIPLLQTALQNLSVVYTVDMLGRNSKVSLSLETIVCMLCNPEKKTLSPLIVPKSSPQRRGLLEAQYCEESGIKGELDCVWIMTPTYESGKLLQAAITHPALAELKNITSYYEERGLDGKESAPIPTPVSGNKSPLGSLQVSIDFTLVNPCIVLTEHQDTNRGVVMNFGYITCQNYVRQELLLATSPDNQDTGKVSHFSVVVNEANVSSLHNPGQYLLQPVNAELRMASDEAGYSQTHISIGSITIDVAQEYYESLLHGAVRHLVADEATLLERQEAQDLTLNNSSIAFEEEKRKSAPAVLNSATLVIEWKELRLRVHGERVAVYLCTNMMDLQYTSQGAEQLTEAHVEKLDVGVEGSKSILCIAREMHPLLFTIQKDTARNSQVINGELGTCALFLEHECVSSAISFLYEPYRRIVLPRYGVSEIVEVEDDYVLTGRLVLSSRKVLHVSSKKYNHIVIDCKGQDVHFLESSSPIMIVDAALTVIFINGNIHLYSRPLEHYVSADNGGYVIMDEHRNKIIRVTEAPRASSWATEALPDSRQEIRINASLSLMIPEVKEPVPQHRLHSSTSVTRALVLNSIMSMDYTTCVENGVGKESGSFVIQHLVGQCLYLINNKQKDFSSLISPFSLTATVTGESQPQANLHRKLHLSSSKSLDVRLRYGDIQLVLSALDNAKKSLGHIESSVGVQMPSDETRSQVAQKGGGNVMNVVLELTHIGFGFVDDSLGYVDVPLVYCNLRSIASPTLEITNERIAIHITCQLQIEYYDQEASTWSPLVEKVPLDVVYKDIKNQTLQDLKDRKGQTKGGIHLRPIHAHVCPTAAKVAKRVIDLVQNVAQVTRLEDKGSEKGTEFFTYVLEEQLGEELVIDFAENSEGRFPERIRLARDHPVSFNFPRIQGREIPVTQHIVIVGQEGAPQVPVPIGRVGCYLAELDFGVRRKAIVADVSLTGGHKRVVFRSNVTFFNELPFALMLQGVGSIGPGERLAVPLDAMRQRCVILPKTNLRCHDVSLGVPYGNLEAFYGQKYFCSCMLDDNYVNTSDSCQKAVHFIISFGQRQRLSSSMIYDVKATFEAPFSVVNNTGVDIQAVLYHKVATSTKKTIQQRVNLAKDYRFQGVVKLDIEKEKTHHVTQVDPFHDVYMDLLVTQPTNQILCRVGAKNLEPVLIRCKDKKARGSQVVLRDENGMPLVIHITYGYRKVSLSCLYWLVNLTHHYLQIVDRHPRKGPQLCAGQLEEGLPPNNTPFLLSSPKISDQTDKAHIYLRIGMLSRDGSMFWSAWSTRVDLDQIGDIFFVNCGEHDQDSVASIAYSISFVGGSVQDTKVVKFTPRWIVINRCTRPLCLQQNVVFPEELRLDVQHCHMLHTACAQGENKVSFRYQESNEIAECDWSEYFPVDRFGDYSLNLCYKPVGTNRIEFAVVRVSCYSRESILYIVVERSTERAPYTIENRTPFMVSVKQRATTQRELIVYPRTSKGFVWENTLAAPVMHITAWEGEQRPPGAELSRCAINLDPLMIKRGSNPLSQDLIVPTNHGNMKLAVRVRGHAGRYAISVTRDTLIDNVCQRPFQQMSFKLHIDSINILAGNSLQDILLLSLVQLDVSLFQGCSSPGENRDEQHLECRFGSMQIDDERRTAVKDVILQSSSKHLAANYFIVHRTMDRRSPMLQINKLEVVLQPITVHLEDSCLFEVIKLYEEFEVAFGRRSTSSLCQFNNSPWIDELEKKPHDEASIIWRDAFIDHLLIEQILVSISLYRGKDSSRDPIRERLGVLSMFVRSVQDARFDWRRISKTDLTDRLWLMATYIRNYYWFELQQQVLNLVHVAGLDVMRSIVTDLLENYFSPVGAAQHIDRSAVLVPRRQATSFASTRDNMEAAMSEWEEIGEDDVPNCRCALIERMKKKGQFARSQVSIEEFAHHTTWLEFVENVSHTELRNFGHLSLMQALRTRSFTDDCRPSLCRRCEYVENIRRQRALTDSMSALPHPSTGIIEWCEFVHHVSWAEFAEMCSPTEVFRFASLVKDSVLGLPHNVRRLEKAEIDQLE